MAALDTGLVIQFPALGRQTIEAVEWEIDSAYLTSTDGFSFKLQEKDRALLRGLQWQPVDLYVNGTLQLQGRIDITRRGETALTGVYKGRDYIAELVECCVDPSVKGAAGETVGLVLARAMAPCGITGILDDSESPITEIRLGKPKQKPRKRKSRKSAKIEDYKPKDGEGVYEFCNRIAARHGVTIQPGPDRTAITLDAPDYEQVPTFSLRRTDDPAAASSNNIVSAEALEDWSKFPTYTMFTGNAPKKGQSGAPILHESSMVDAVSIEIQGRSLLPQMQNVVDLAWVGRRLPKDPSLPPNQIYRLLHHRDQEARTQEQIDNAATRAQSERLKDSLTYTCTVKGHTDPESGAIWTVGAMVNVSDAVAEIQEKLWIAGRRLYYTSQGAMTDLELWRPNSFVIGLEE